MVRRTYRVMIFGLISGIWISRIKASASVIFETEVMGRGNRLTFFYSADIVDIKPANMEELTEVITAAEFHPIHCNLFMYSSSKGSIKLSDMRASALCDQHAKGKKGGGKRRCMKI